VRASTAMLGGQGAADFGNACALRSPVIGSPRSKRRALTRPLLSQHRHGQPARVIRRPSECVQCACQVCAMIRSTRFHCSARCSTRRSRSTPTLVFSSFAKSPRCGIASTLRNSPTRTGPTTRQQASRSRSAMPTLSSGVHAVANIA
jgi:hypothetical protein